MIKVKYPLKKKKVSPFQRVPFQIFRQDRTERCRWVSWCSFFTILFEVVWSLQGLFCSRTWTTGSRTVQFVMGTSKTVLKTIHNSYFDISVTQHIHLFQLRLHPWNIMHGARSLKIFDFCILPTEQNLNSNHCLKKRRIQCFEILCL